MKSAVWFCQSDLCFAALCACAYSCFAYGALVNFYGDRSIRTSLLPRYSILKPLKGMDPEIYASLRSHCLQEYSKYEIIFGVNEENDPAVEWVEQLQTRVP